MDGVPDEPSVNPDDDARLTPDEQAAADRTAPPGPGGGPGLAPKLVPREDVGQTPELHMVEPGEARAMTPDEIVEQVEQAELDRAADTAANRLEGDVAAQRLVETPVEPPTIPPVREQLETEAETLADRAASYRELLVKMDQDPDLEHILTIMFKGRYL